MDCVIGIDVGGTNIKVGTFLADGTAQGTISIPTPQPSTPEAVLDAIVAGIRQLPHYGDAQAIGLGMPGPVDRGGKIALVCINLDGWQHIPLGQWLEERTGLPTVLANDANCAGMGEAWLGAGQGLADVMLLTLGTGVGGAIVMDGQLFTGRTGAAAELGLMSINFDGYGCNSGNYGSLEQYCSIRGLTRLSGDDPATLAHKAHQGDREALGHWHTYGQWLGVGIANLLYILTPEMVIIGGGISASAEFFLPSVIAEVEKRVLPSSRQDLAIVPATLGNRAGMVGAAKLAWQLLP